MSWPTAASSTRTPPGRPSRPEVGVLGPGSGEAAGSRRTGRISRGSRPTRVSEAARRGGYRGAGRNSVLIVQAGFDGLLNPIPPPRGELLRCGERAYPQRDWYQNHGGDVYPEWNAVGAMAQTLPRPQPDVWTANCDICSQALSTLCLPHFGSPRRPSARTRPSTYYGTIPG